MSKKLQQKEYVIKIPVFTSDRIERTDHIFSGITYQEFINNAKSKIEKHNKNESSVTSDKRNKIIKREIGNIQIIENSFDTTPYLLLKISAYNTNLEGCLITPSEIHQLENNDKIGSENNFVMLYPKIIGSEKQSIFWVILVYDDPKKDSYDIISTAKLVLTKILNQPIKSVKLPAVLKEIKENKILPQIKMQLNAISFDESTVNPKFEKYRTNSKLTRKEEYDFLNMPFKEIEELIRSPFNEFKQRIIKLIVSKKEYKITQEHKADAQHGFNDLVEQIFNMSTIIYEDELEKLYENDFVTLKLKTVLEHYLKNGDE